MSAHVPAIGQQRHRVGHEADSDLDRHHYRCDSDHHPGTPFRLGKIGNEVVRLAKTRMICPMHLIQRYRDYRRVSKKRSG